MFTDGAVFKALWDLKWAKAGQRGLETGQKHFLEHSSWSGDTPLLCVCLTVHCMIPCGGRGRHHPDHVPLGV